MSVAKSELLVVNAGIRTVDSNDSLAGALLVRDGVFAAVGDDEKVRAVASPSATVVDLKGRTVIPGIIDPHNHLSAAAFEPDSVDCATPPRTTLDEVLQSLELGCRDRPPGQWIRGGNFLPEAIVEQRGPTRYELDDVSPHNPVFLIDISFHRGWTNSAGLEALGIDAHTPQPWGGQIEKDRRGQPTGYLIEAAAGWLHRASWKDYATRDPQRAVELLVAKMHEYASLGITGVGDAMVNDDIARLYRRVDELNLLPITVQQMYHGDFFFAMQDLRRQEHVQAVLTQETDRLRGGTLKVFVDPGFPDGPALDKVHGDCTVHQGGLFYSASQVQEIAVHASSLGIDTAIHAVGNCAVDMVIDAYRKVRASSNERRALRIEHAFVADPRQGESFAELDLDLVVNPGIGHYTADLFAAWRGEDQPQLRLLPVRSMFDAGVRVSFASDHPAGPVNPMKIMWSSVARLTAAGRPFDADEGVTPSQALRAMTINSAHASKRADEEGSIEAGKKANFVVLDADPITCPTAEIEHITVLRTYVDGVAIFQRDEE